jgi:hypothetical protein
VSSGRLLWLPAALKDAGLEVDTAAGWETRGRAAMTPRVLVLHHTAGPKGRNAPSLNVVINGRSDLPGPLCHILIGRDGTCFVIASGVAHHAGKGSWQGVTGNAHAIGIEVENVGTKAEPWTDELVDVMVRASRACINAARIPVSMVCFHREWAPSRKVDPHSLNPAAIRGRIATGTTPPPPAQEDDMEPEAFVVIAYRTIFDRLPETVAVIGEQAKRVKSLGQAAFLGYLRQSPEGVKRWGPQR